MRLIVIIIQMFVARQGTIVAQPLSGRVESADTHERLAGASISLYKTGVITGLVANKDGEFYVSNAGGYDSIRFSMVGYHSSVMQYREWKDRPTIGISLTLAPASLPEVRVKPLKGVDIIRETIARIPSWQPAENFESRGFYREIIRDRENYFSIAEAIFSAQYFPSGRDYKLRLERGRSKQDVTYTRLFEDFHPGGGPQSVAGNSLVTNRPDFLNLKKIKNFTYKLDSIVQFEDRHLYCIHFDQRPDVKEALEKGTIYIDTEDEAVVRYEATNSPYGTPYIKDLTGTDKIFAQLLHINFQRLGWTRRVDFAKTGDKWLLSYAEAEHHILYQQPKKEIDLDMTISIELLMTALQQPLVREISKDEEWKRKNLVANLPVAFDPAFWGADQTISPTAQVQAIVAALSGKDDLHLAADSVSGWIPLHANMFLSYHHNDTLTLIPLMKSWWQDDESAGMLFKEWEGDIDLQTRIRVMSNTTPGSMPDKGFQQAGIMIRKSDQPAEQYIFLSVGTGGNPNPKVFFKKTIKGKSKTVLEKRDDMQGWLRLTKKGTAITAYYRSGDSDEWKKIGDCEADWLSGKFQVGMGLFAGFPGQGPHMQPDMKAEFWGTKLERP